jgi:hypothetical protein
MSRDTNCVGMIWSSLARYKCALGICYTRHLFVGEVAALTRRSALKWFCSMFFCCILLSASPLSNLFNMKCLTVTWINDKFILCICFHDLVCWLGLLHKICVSFSFLVSGLYMLYQFLLYIVIDWAVSRKRIGDFKQVFTKGLIFIG